MVSGMCSNPTTQTGQLFYSHPLHCPHFFVFTISSPFQGPLGFQVPSLQSRPGLLQAALPSLGGGHRPPESAGISFHQTQIQKGCCSLWCRSGSRIAVGRRLRCPKWEGSEHVTGVPPERQGWRRGWQDGKEKSELRSEKMNVFTAPNKEKALMSYSSFNTPPFFVFTITF